MPSEEDCVLIARAKAGDDEAFRRLREKHTRFITNVCRHFSALDQDDVEDAVQTTFWRAHRFLGSFRGDSSFSTWLHQIAASVCLDARARKKNHLSLDGTTYVPVEERDFVPEVEARV